jgi:CheY-like chemotaxis protein
LKWRSAADAASREDQIVNAPAPARLSTVLYIEDNLSNVDLVAGILARRPDWALTSAVTGRLGLELATSIAPTVILLDLHLPDIQGIDVIMALRANPVTSAIPVAIVSADATHDNIIRLLDAGAQEYFVKPIEISQILTFLDDHVATRSGE